LAGGVERSTGFQLIVLSSRLEQANKKHVTVHATQKAKLSRAQRSATNLKFECARVYHDPSSILVAPSVLQASTRSFASESELEPRVRS
jgi:hypothetical protein